MHLWKAHRVDELGVVLLAIMGAAGIIRRFHHTGLLHVMRFCIGIFVP